MLLAYCRHDLAKRHVKALLPILLTTVVLFRSQSTAAQTCAVVQKGQSQGKCLNANAACKSGGIQGVCANGGGPGNYECDCKTPTPPAQPTREWCQTNNLCPVTAPLTNHLFSIQDLGGGRCIDAGPPASWAVGTPVVINACSQSFGKQIQVAEIDSTHDVGLSVYRTPTNAAPSAHLAVRAPTAPGAASTGGATNVPFCIGVRGGTVAAGAALELQNCTASSPAQRFAVDGDAILMGSQTSGKVTREFVIERANGSTVPQTPLVVAARELAEDEPLRLDARYFRFNAVDNSGASPTSGFLTVADETHLVCAAQCGGWGTVIQIDDSQPLVLTSLSNPCPPTGCTATRGDIEVADGTTIRGYRSQTYNGPQIQTCAVSKTTDWPVFQAGGQSAPSTQAVAFTGQAVRFTGFRLLGPIGDSGCGKLNVDSGTYQNAIEVDRIPFWSFPLPSAWIDHMEISHWPGSGFAVGSDAYGDPNAQPTPCTGCPYPNPPVALAVANFMHDSVYGDNSGGAQFSHTRASVFYGAGNQPVVSREDGCIGGYAAVDNLFLSETASGSKASDDVDMHGSRPPGSWSEGLAGDYFDVGWNTFLKVAQTFLWWHPGDFQNNVNERGTSCRFTVIHENVFRQPQDMAIRVASADPEQYVTPPAEFGNTFNAQDPTLGPLLVGDFDGDKIDDVFLATGAAWYYSSGGQAEWRFLNRASEPVSSLLLGDFDGDGRTDVLTIHGSNIDVSWAGVSAWQTINVTNVNGTAWPLADLAVGDFEGKGHSDLLLATGSQWFLASGGQNWTPWPVPNPDKIQNLRFGHFNDTCGTETQILRVQKGQWQVTCWSKNSWNPIGAAPVDSMNGLMTGDFDGQGYTQLARALLISASGNSLYQYQWQYTSPRLSSSWSSLGTSSSPILSFAIGNFQGGQQDGLITWGDNHFYFTHACTTNHPCPQDGPQLLSRQVMR